MNKNRLAFRAAGMALMMGILLGVSMVSDAQSTPGSLVKSAKTPSGSSITYVEAPRGDFDIDIFSKEAGEPTDFAAAAQRCAGAKQQLVFAMNGAKCDKSLKPVGLLLKGLTKYKDLLWPDMNAFGNNGPSAVFAIDKGNGANIIAGKNYNAANDLGNYQLAIQSGAILINKGLLNPGITRATNRQMCNGIGIKANGDVVLAITNGPVTLREFAIFLQDLNCRDVMLLDEGASCQWYAPGNKQKPGKLGEILVVTRK